MEHVLSSAQFGKEDLGDLFERADYFKKHNAEPRDEATRHLGRSLCTLFYQPSTRTRLSFEAAGGRLGMSIISTENAADFSSAIKGESIEDTIKIVNGYAHLIVIRHPEAGSAARAAEASEIPVINAGDGGNEHPTQALLDTYTIREKAGRTGNLDVAIGGDLLYGRTVRSLVDIMSRVYEGNTFTFIAPDDLQISPDIEMALRGRDIPYRKTSSLEDGLDGADVVYWTRLQAENIQDVYKKQRILAAIASGDFILDKKALGYMPASAIILHPLPRVGEINPEIDGYPQAQYFKQAHNGLPVRQAVIDRLLSNHAEIA
jgi:aspartate carbamoyltransferase catalytic subunit